MVSPVWKAASEGDILKLHELLNDAASVDIEIKDHTGETPLIQAVRNGHVDVVRVLLEKGADPLNASSQGRPDQYTSDTAILDLLGAAREKAASSGASSTAYAQSDAYPQDLSTDPPKAYFVPPPGAYVYYPAMHPGAPMMPDGSIPYYHAPPPNTTIQNGTDAGGPGHLPPPEIARLIPCRYFPACRYGPSCIFAHPQGPYFQGPPPPPTQYAVPYDPMTQPPYPGAYYAIPPSSYPPPPNAVPTHGTPLSPPPTQHTAAAPLNHTKSPSDVVSPVQHPFSPSGPPPPLPYGVAAPMSPSYPQQGPVPIPVGVAPLPPVLHAHAPSQQASPAIYTPTSPATQNPGSAQGHRREGSIAYTNGMARTPNGDSNVTAQSPPAATQPEAFLPLNPNGHRETNHTRRGSMRRGPPHTYKLAKPPCLFFPTGRCRNGDECRFPHVMPDPSNSPNGAHYPPKFPRTRPHHGSGVPNSLEEKMASLAVQENGATPNGDVRSSDKAGNRPFKSFHGPNGVRHEKRHAPLQRVPNADDFPVLVGSTTPPSRSPGPNGRTAAQVLQAPPPARRHSKDQLSSGESSDHERSVESAKEDKPSLEINVVNTNGMHEPSVSRVSATFAAVANTSVAPDVSNQVSVSA